jgi:hypothetical protein
MPQSIAVSARTELGTRPKAANASTSSTALPPGTGKLGPAAAAARANLSAACPGPTLTRMHAHAIDRNKPPI